MNELTCLYASSCVQIYTLITGIIIKATYDTLLALIHMLLSEQLGIRLA